jgi:hypothetical protein
MHPEQGDAVVGEVVMLEQATLLLQAGGNAA